jgi:hypothetical protein
MLRTDASPPGVCVGEVTKPKTAAQTVISLNRYSGGFLGLPSKLTIRCRSDLQYHSDNVGALDSQMIKLTV